MTLELSPLQLPSLIFDFVPPWLGPSLIFLGVEVILVGAIQKSLPETSTLWTRLSKQESLMVTGSFALGILFSASAVLQQFSLVGTYAAMLFGLGRLIEGAAAVRFFKRVLLVARGQGHQGGMERWAKRLLVVFFAFVIAGWLVVRILTRGPIYGTVEKSIRLVWTGLTLFVAVYGIAPKLRFAEDVLNNRLKMGFVFCVGGASIYNFGTVMDVGVFLIGLLAYSVGFWVAVLALVRSESHREEPLLS